MSRWKRRDPAIFPVHFADTVERAVKSQHSDDPKILLHAANGKPAARIYLDKFREWRFCLRERGTPSHRCFAIERDYAIKTSTAEAAGVVSIYVRVEAKIIDELFIHNPDLGIPS